MNKKVQTKKSSPTANSYKEFLDGLKQRVRSAQVRAAFSVNAELIKLYWEIGKEIADRQESEGWGANIIEKIGKDLQNAFPGIEGFSRTNIFRMRAFYAAYQKVPQAVGQLAGLPIFGIPWSHNAIIIEKIKDDDARLWYAKQTLANGWSREALKDVIKTNLYGRSGKAVSNFKDRLPGIQSALVQEATKDPYIFDFLELGEGHHERDVESGLIAHVEKFLLELGKGFAFIGRQYPLEVAGTDYYIDLLFFHTELNCYVVIDLKAKEFAPRDAGQMNFYLSAIDDRLKLPHHNPTIGMILCKTKKNIVVEYALRDINKPMGVAGYETAISEKLPKELKGSLPTIKEIEAELENG